MDKQVFNFNKTDDKRKNVFYPDIFNRDIVQK